MGTMPAETTKTPRRDDGSRRRRATHSMEAIIDAATAMLDEAGESALTFRALAARLGGGVGSLYWYVASKDELLDRVTDSIIAGMLAATPETKETEAPLETMRRLAHGLYDTMTAHPWMGSYLMRNVQLQPHAMEFYERLGEPTLSLDLLPRERFHAVSAVLGFVIGVGAELGQEAGLVESAHPHEESLQHEYAQTWRALPADDFPFIHAVADEFERHRDEEQFAAGLDFILAGIGMRAEVRRRGRELGEPGRASSRRAPIERSRA